MLADTFTEFFNHLFILKCHNCFLIHHISPPRYSRNLILIVSLLLSLLPSEESYSGASLYLHFILDLLCDTSISLFFFESDNYNCAALKMRSQCLHIVWNNNMFLFLFSVPFLVVFSIVLCLWFLLSTEMTFWNHGGWYFTMSFPELVVVNWELIVASIGRIIFTSFYTSHSSILNFT